MRTSGCSIFHHFGPSLRPHGPFIKSLTSSFRHFRSCSNNGVLIMASISAATASQGGHSEDSTHMALLEAHRYLFENRKKFPGVDHPQKKQRPQQPEPHSDDAAVAARNSTLFSNTTSDGPESGASPTSEALPSAAELDRVLPSLQQLRDEIPSTAGVQRAMQSDGDNSSMWISGAAKKDDEEE
ncbi:hypothetical protein LSM04_005633 [Trypanosoma melophagium]|uniref:uncharacterized protein n=1 Tax=Trypanosoma melophagium TaxID=715481 RepID=UPI00351AA019|nr:hypothetical protein LSM04_005633 [Trypanosoma melophagium]